MTSIVMTPSPVEHAEAYWAMCDDAEVKELLTQLFNGLIHPLEYADAVKRIATRYGIQ